MQDLWKHAILERLSKYMSPSSSRDRPHEWENRPFRRFAVKAIPSSPRSDISL
jgi:hypothetical protein